MGVFFMLKKFICLALSFLTLYSLKVVSAKPIFSAFSSSFEICIGEKSNGSFYTVNNLSYGLFNGITGESCTVDENYTEEYVISFFNAEKVFVERVENLTITYYFSPSINKVEIINGKKVNLQTCKSNNYLKVGSPLIYGSF